MKMKSFFKYCYENSLKILGVIVIAIILFFLAEEYIYYGLIYPIFHKTSNTQDITSTTKDDLINKEFDKKLDQPTNYKKVSKIKVFFRNSEFDYSKSGYYFDTIDLTTGKSEKVDTVTLPDNEDYLYNESYSNGSLFYETDDCGMGGDCSYFIKKFNIEKNTLDTIYSKENTADIILGFLIDDDAKNLYIFEKVKDKNYLKKYNIEESKIEKEIDISEYYNEQKNDIKISQDGKSIAIYSSLVSGHRLSIISTNTLEKFQTIELPSELYNQKYDLSMLSNDFSKYVVEKINPNSASGYDLYVYSIDGKELTKKYAKSQSYLWNNNNDKIAYMTDHYYGTSTMLLLKNNKFLLLPQDGKPESNIDKPLFWLSDDSLVYTQELYGSFEKANLRFYLLNPYENQFISITPSNPFNYSRIVENILYIENIK